MRAFEQANVVQVRGNATTRLQTGSVDYAIIDGTPFQAADNYGEADSSRPLRANTHMQAVMPSTCARSLWSSHLVTICSEPYALPAAAVPQRTQVLVAGLWQ